MPLQSPKISHKNEDGSVMVPALWISLILAMLSLGMILMSQDTLLEVKTQQKMEQAWLKSESAISIAKYNIARRQNPWVPRDAPYSVTIDDDDIRVFIRSPRGRIDINYVSPGLMSQLLVSLGYEPSRASNIADYILDWRDADDLVRLNGAETNDYIAAGYPSGPANRQFQSLSELQDVFSLSYADYQCLAPFLTTFRQSAPSEPAFMPQELRALLGIPAPITSLETGFRRGSLTGQVFEIVADAPYSPYTFTRVTEIIRYTGNPADPIGVHRQDKTFVPRAETITPGTNIHCPLEHAQSGL